MELTAIFSVLGLVADNWEIVVAAASALYAGIKYFKAETSEEKAKQLQTGMDFLTAAIEAQVRKSGDIGKQVARTVEISSAHDPEAAAVIHESVKRVKSTSAASPSKVAGASELGDWARHAAQNAREQRQRASKSKPSGVAKVLPMLFVAVLFTGCAGQATSTPRLTEERILAPETTEDGVILPPEIVILWPVGVSPNPQDYFTSVAPDGSVTTSAPWYPPDWSQ